MPTHKALLVYQKLFQKANDTLHLKNVKVLIAPLPPTPLRIAQEHICSLRHPGGGAHFSYNAIQRA